MADSLVFDLRAAFSRTSEGFAELAAGRADVLVCGRVNMIKLLSEQKEGDPHDFRYYDSVHSVLMFPRRIDSYHFVVTKGE